MTLQNTLLSHISCPGIAIVLITILLQWLYHFINLQQLLTTEITYLLFGAVAPHTEKFALSTINSPQ